MSEPTSDPGSESRARYRRAGAVYFLLALAIVGLTAAHPALASPERRADLVHLLVGLPFIALFALLVAFGDRIVAAPLRWLGAAPERAGRAGRWGQEKLTMILTLSALGRALFYLASGVGRRPRLRPSLGIETVAASSEMLLGAVLMAVIVVFLARASWVPFLRLRR